MQWARVRENETVRVREWGRMIQESKNERQRTSQTSKGRTRVENEGEIGGAWNPVVVWNKGTSYLWKVMRHFVMSITTSTYVAFYINLRFIYLYFSKPARFCWPDMPTESNCYSLDVGQLNQQAHPNGWRKIHCRSATGRRERENKIKTISPATERSSISRTIRASNSRL